MSLRIAVIGAGHLGRIHARLLSAIEDVRVVAITDPSDAARVAAGEASGIPTFSSHRQVLSEIDAAILAAPSGLHHAIATDLLEAGKHLLVEKPLTTTAADAVKLVQLAKRHGCILQVGHVERFNPAWTAAQDVAQGAKYVEATRASSFPGRCLDVGVVMDLMIHDVELVLSLTTAELVDVQASGLSVVSEHEDLAEARLTFACGLVANLKASRVSLTAARNMQIFGPLGFAELDFGKPAVTIVRPSDAIAERRFHLAAMGDPKKAREEIFGNHLEIATPELQPRNAIADELQDFVASIRHGHSPTVSGVQGARAVSAAERILTAIDQRTWNGARDLAVRGPHVAAGQRQRRAA